MENFKGQYRDTRPHNNPQGTWQLAKNIVKRHGKIVNEDGFREKLKLRGTYLGDISTNEHTVYFQKISKYIDEIGYVDEKTGEYHTVIRDNLHFNLNCLIEGTYVYNNKKDLIVIWSNNIKEDSSPPCILNVTNPEISINTDYTLEGGFNSIKLFPDVDQPEIKIDYIDNSNLESYVAYITVAYVNNSNSTLLYFPLSHIAYTGGGTENPEYKGLDLTFNNLSTKYDKIKVGIVTNNEGNLQGFESNIFSYKGSSLNVRINSLSGYNKVTAEELIVDTETFEKVRTITKNNSELFFANVVKGDVINFQEYANKMYLKPKVIHGKAYQEPTFMPNEVYDFYIEFRKPDGTFYPNAFHIPGRRSMGYQASNGTFISETANINDLDQSTLNALGLIGVDFNPDDKVFHYVNTGRFIGNSLEWGYWENTEKYPEEFGEELEGKSKRMFRFPSIREVMSGGRNVPQIRNKDDRIPSFKFGVTLANFENVIPEGLKDRVKGYRISYVKRTFNNSLVLGDAFALRTVETEIKVGDNTIPILSPIYLTELYQNFSVVRHIKLLSPELFKYKPNLNITHIEAVYGTNETTGINKVLSNNRFLQINSNIEYVKENNTFDRNAWQEEGAVLELPINNWIWKHFPYSETQNIVYVYLYQLKKDLYTGFNHTDLVIAGVSDRNYIPLSNGDVFTENEMDLTIHYNFKYLFTTHRFYSIILKGLYQSINLAYIHNTKSEEENRIVIDSNSIPIIDGFDYTVDVETPIGASSLLDINGITTFNASSFSKYNNTFPYRINRSTKIPNENNDTRFLRNFPVNNYYEMPNTKGEIIALRATDRILYIQQEYALFIAQAKDSLKTDGAETYLGNVDLFYRPPMEIVYDSMGYIGCTSQYACRIFKDFFITVDQIRGKIFLITGNKVNEISRLGNKTFFKNNLQTLEIEDTPYTGNGIIVGYDEDNDRILITKRDVQNSFTYSFDIADQMWVSEHDYIPNNYLRNNKGLYSIYTNKTSSKFIHNAVNSKGYFYGEKYVSYVDLIFNGYPNESKMYQSVEWITEAVEDILNVLYEETITGIMVYNYHQTTGIVQLGRTNMRNVEESWRFNELRDIVKNKDLPIVNMDTGEVNKFNLEYNKPYFEKRNFIGKFIIVRLLMDNKSDNEIVIHSVNVKALKSHR